MKMPECFIVDDNGKLEQVATLEDWRNLVIASPSNTGRESRTNRLRNHVNEEPTQVLADLNNTSYSEEGQVSNQAGKDDQLGTRTSQTGNQDTTMRRYFDGSDTDIKTPGLKQLDCCTTKMAQHIQTQQGANSWFPSMVNINRRGLQYQKLVDYTYLNEWRGVASVIDTSGAGEAACPNSCQIECPGMLCNALIISPTAQPKLICCFSSSIGVETQETAHDCRTECALRLGRKLKKEFLKLDLNKDQQSARFYFKVLVLSVPKENGEVTKVWDSEDDNKQTVPYPYADCNTQFSIACNGLAEKLLKTRSTVKNRYGDILADHLSDEQAKVLLKGQDHILVVRGGSGTGKTVIALHMVQDAIYRRGYKETCSIYLQLQ